MTDEFGRRFPPPVPQGSIPPPEQQWYHFLKLHKYIVENTIGIPGGFLGVYSENIAAGAEFPDLGEPENGWAAANHSHTINTDEPENPTGTAPDEGESDALMRADATIMQGIVTTKGDVLTYSTVPARLAVGANDRILVADSSAATGLAWRTPAAVLAASGLAWVKYTVTHTPLKLAAMANDIELFSLPATGVIHAVKIKHSILFAGTGITDYKLSVGIVGNLTKYAAAFDVDTAVTNTNFQLSSTVGSENHGAVTSIRLAATSTGANLDQSTAGSVDVWVLTSLTS